MEEKRKDIFDEIVKSKFDNYNVPVDKELWSDLERRLSAKKETIFRKPWFYGAISAAACVIFALFFFFNNNSSVSEKTFVSENKTENNNSSKELVSEEKSIEEKIVISEEKIKKNIAEINRKKSIQKNNTQEDNFNILSDFIEEKETETDKKDPELLADNESETISKEVNESKNEPENNQEKIRKLKTLEDNIPDFIEEKAIMPKKNKNSYLLAASFGTSSLQGIDNNTNYLLDNDYLSSPNHGGMWNGDKENGLESPNSAYKDITHYPAISFGLTMQKKITSVFSLESGLVYTYLHSKLENDKPLKQAESHLHYLGIPVNGIFQVYNKDPKWNIYISAGGMIEKGIHSQFKEIIYEETGNNNTIFNSSIKGFQWSVNGGVGIDYQIYKNLSIYFEPRLIYYFDNNQPASVRSDNPFSFGIKGGLRINFKN